MDKKTGVTEPIEENTGGVREYATERRLVHSVGEVRGREVYRNKCDTFILCIYYISGGKT